ncbi:hypothetical protein CES86_3709 [Brucella lupini]|uniref:Uncharacterized protein n=1 Tax=Brucella lupini TaxID=255457 RepID=A0A256GI14_9HYPH|nr:hypothetical protein CES86_3709 [Brucella lupini]
MLRSVPVLSVELRAPRCGSHGNLHRLFRLWFSRTLTRSAAGFFVVVFVR